MTMSRPVKIVAAVLGALLLLSLAGAAFVATRFNADALKALAIQRVKQDYQRTLAMPGRLQLAFWPSLGVKLGELSLSEPGSAATFASLREAHVSLALWPLLRGQVIVDRIRVDGLAVTVTRRPDGRLSIDDLLGNSKTATSSNPASSASQPLGFDVAGVAVTDLKLRYDNRQARQLIELSKADFQTGRLAPGQPSDISFKGRISSNAPVVDANLAVQGRLTFEPGRLAVEKLDAKLVGRLLGWPSAALHLALAQFEQRGPAITLPQLTLEAEWPHPRGGRLKLTAQGQAKARLDRQDAELQLAGSVDGSRFSLKAGAPRLSPLQTRFTLEVDQLDIDRWRPAPVAGPASAAADAPIDLSALRELHTQGTLQIGKLQAAGLQLTELRATLKVAGGRAGIEALQASLYGGKVSGSLSADATGAPRLAVAQTLSDIQIGPLLKDLLGKAPPIDGRGNVVLDLTAQGTTVKALRQALAGRAKLELRNGAVHGFNIAQTLRSAKAKIGLGGTSEGRGNAGESSDFSELNGSFLLQRGVAHTDDLLAKSPLLRVGASGDIDIADERLDMLVKATVVPTLQGQGGPELQALGGQTIPVRLSGPFTAVSYKVDIAGVAQELARQKIGEKGKEQMQDKLKKLLGR